MPQPMAGLAQDLAAQAFSADFVAQPLGRWLPDAGPAYTPGHTSEVPTQAIHSTQQSTDMWASTAGPSAGGAPAELLPRTQVPLPPGGRSAVAAFLERLSPLERRLLLSGMPRDKLQELLCSGAIGTSPVYCTRCLPSQPDASSQMPPARCLL